LSKILRKLKQKQYFRIFNDIVYFLSDNEFFFNAHRNGGYGCVIKGPFESGSIIQGYGSADANPDLKEIFTGPKQCCFAK
jgi:hypothetical protein